MPSSPQLKLATHELGFSFSIAEDAYSTQPAMNGAGSLTKAWQKVVVQKNVVQKKRFKEI